MAEADLLPAVRNATGQTILIADARLAAVKSRMVPRAMPSMWHVCWTNSCRTLKDTYADQPHAHKEKGNQHCFFKPSLRHASSKDLSYAKAK